MRPGPRPDWVSQVEKSHSHNSFLVHSLVGRRMLAKAGAILLYDTIAFQNPKKFNFISIRVIWCRCFIASFLFCRWLSPGISPRNSQELHIIKAFYSMLLLLSLFSPGKQNSTSSQLLPGIFYLQAECCWHSEHFFFLLFPFRQRNALFVSCISLCIVLRVLEQ